MNSDWIAFLKSNGAKLRDNQHIEFAESSPTGPDRLYPIHHLALFSVSGNDAAGFLQGQLTCDINDIQPNQTRLAAYCNAKGRVISTLLIGKKGGHYLVILPAPLLTNVINKLRMYILRSKVVIEDQSSQLCLLGLNLEKTQLTGLPALPAVPFAGIETDLSFVRLPGSAARYLIVGDYDPATRFWTQTTSAPGVQAGNSTDWEFQDLCAGLPWFSDDKSEVFIPQMLNIDKLGGISLNKGCYIGQEIVARTHYLGKAKRNMFLAETSKTAMLTPQTAVIDARTSETTGRILSYQSNSQVMRLLLVLQTDDTAQKSLTLDNADQNKLALIPFQ